MSWSFKWVLSYGNDFKHDYHISFTPQERKTAVYTYKAGEFGSSEVSAFIKGADRQIFHTYSCYARGLEMLQSTHHRLDLLPKGRERAGPVLPDGLCAPARPVRGSRKAAGIATANVEVGEFPAAFW